MVGESAPRLQYFGEIMKELPFDQMEPEIIMMNTSSGLCLHKGSELFLLFFRRPEDPAGFSFLTTDMAEEYELMVYDLWNRRECHKGTAAQGHVDVALPEWALVRLEAKKKAR
jgi:hypothetical protein